MNLNLLVFIKRIIYDGYKSIGTHWIALYMKDINLTCSDSFGVKQIPKEIKTLIEN